MEEKEFITLGQLLKVLGYVQTGGEAKMRIHEFDIQINGEAENRRGRKLYPEDEIIINGEVIELEHEG